MEYDSVLLRQILEGLCLYHLCKTEDLAASEPAILDEIYSELRHAMSDAISVFDERMVREKPLGWSIKDKRSRTLFTEFGEVTYTRRIYIDEYDERRYLTDEVLDICPRRYISANAFSIVTGFASDIPYARAAALLCRHTSSAITAPAVMGCLRELGEILKEQDEKRRRHLFDEGVCPTGDINTKNICAEADGVWVHLQKENNRFAEIKAFCAYEGKVDGKRKNTVHHGAITDPTTFSEQAVAKLASRFSLPDIDCVYYNSDGESWCKAVPDYIKGPEIFASLDPWHLNKMIDAAFPLRATRNRVYSYLKNSDTCGLVDFLKTKSEQKSKGQDKVKALYKYVNNNKALINNSGPSLGTMEGTIAHVYAARMKVWGGGWSKRGASDMARIRSTLFSGEKLPCPHQRTQLSKTEIRRREMARKRRLENVKYDILLSEGKGYEMPRGTVMPFSSEQSLIECWPVWSD